MLHKQRSFQNIEKSINLSAFKSVIFKPRGRRSIEELFNFNKSPGGRENGWPLVVLTRVPQISIQPIQPIHISKRQKLRWSDLSWLIWNPTFKPDHVLEMCKSKASIIDVHLIFFQENSCLFIFFSFHDVAASKWPTPDRVFQQDCETWRMPCMFWSQKSWLWAKCAILGCKICVHRIA